MYSKLKSKINEILKESISTDRIKKLQVLIEYIQNKIDQNQEVKLNFICTHNSRRSQFAQIWAHTAAYYYGVKVQCYSGGVEITAFNERAVKTIENVGFKVEKTGDDNPVYKISLSESNTPSLEMYSKLYDDQHNPTAGFSAIMTCSHADENCPFISGTEKRIPITYEDPKAYDNSPMEVEMYEQRSFQIASEMFYVFSKLICLEAESFN